MGTQTTEDIEEGTQRTEDIEEGDTTEGVEEDMKQE